MIIKQMKKNKKANNSKKCKIKKYKLSYNLKSPEYNIKGDFYEYWIN